MTVYRYYSTASLITQRRLDGTLKPSSTGSLASLAPPHRRCVADTVMDHLRGAPERQQAADSVKHRHGGSQTSPVLAARLALDWTD
jgi:hypothetical protein